MKIAFAKREVTGKKVAGLRKQGQTPVVCYGNKEEPQSYAVATKALKTVLASDSMVFETGGDAPGKQVMIQDIAYHPTTEEPIHVDFLFVDATQEVTHEVPVQVEGEAPAEKTHNGQVLVTLDKIEVRALPQHIPSQVIADISTLAEIGSRLTASAIPLPENVTLVTNADEIIVSIVEESQEEEEPTETDEDYLSKIEVTGKGGKKDAEDGEDGGEEQSDKPDDGSSDGE